MFLQETAHSLPHPLELAIGRPHRFRERNIARVGCRFPSAFRDDTTPSVATFGAIALADRC